MARRTPAKVRQYIRRGRGVMKKADEIHSLIHGVKAAVFFLDGTKLWTYESEPGWVSKLPSMLDIREERLNPAHFITVFEHEQAMAQNGEPAAVGPPVLVPTSQSTSHSTPEQSLFLSPEPQDKSPPSTPATQKTGPLRPLHTPTGPSCAISPATLRRRATRGPVSVRRTRNAACEKDVYGFTDMDGIVQG